MYLEIDWPESGKPRRQFGRLIDYEERCHRDRYRVESDYEVNKRPWYELNERDMLEEPPTVGETRLIYWANLGFDDNWFRGCYEKPLWVVRGDKSYAQICTENLRELVPGTGKYRYGMRVQSFNTT